MRRTISLLAAMPSNAGQHEVHEHQVDVARERGLQAGAAVVLLQDLVAGAPEVVGDEIGDGGVVFHQEDALFLLVLAPDLRVGRCLLPCYR